MPGYEGVQSVIQIVFFPILSMTQLIGIYSPFLNFGWVCYDIVVWALTAYFTFYPLANLDSVYRNLKNNTSEPYNTKLAANLVEKRKPRSSEEVR